jgi:hypothetical protein
VSLRARVHTSTAAALLGAYGIWILTWALPTRYWSLVAIGVALLVAAAGAIMSQPWSRFLVYAFAILLTLRWLWIVGGQVADGFLVNYLRGMPPLRAVLTFVPAAIMFMLTGYCCYVAHRYVGNRDGHV